MNIFFEIHTDLARGGPGDRLSTQQAFALMSDLPANLLILDTGCGPGMQTFDLAEISTGKIIAIDTHQPFLDQLRACIDARGWSDRIQVVNGSMFALNFPTHSVDILWSEGAIYIIGFEHGLKTWRALLKPGGYLAVTEISWLQPDPPEEVYSFWMAEYPGMRNIEQNCKILQAAGYREAGHFSLPPASWWRHGCSCCARCTLTARRRWKVSRRLKKRSICTGSIRTGTDMSFT